MSKVDILHHGAVTGVTGSCHQYICSSHNLLIDCGLFQGSESDRDLSDFPFDVSAVDALIVTHGHIDHVGRIPWLIASGFRGAIICSEPTARLLPIILRDALEIHIRDDQALVDSVVRRLERQIVAVEFGKWVGCGTNAPPLAPPLGGGELSVANSVSVTLQNPATSHTCATKPPPLAPPLSGGGLSVANSASVSLQNPAASHTSATKPLPLAPPLSGGGLSAAGGLSIRLQNAGHILGSAYVELEFNGHRTVFSGDLGSPGAMFVDPPASPEQADVLVIETTYGDRVHTSRQEREQALARLVNKALSDAGTLLIPAFSLGRTQELLSMFEHLLHTGQLRWPDSKPLPIILDSPLASELTFAYRSLAEYWPARLTQRRLIQRLPLAFDNLVTVDHHGEHRHLVKRLKHTDQPAIVIAASGMCQGGRIVNYLEALASNPKTDILFVGYQAQGTLGRALLENDVVKLRKAGIQNLKANVLTLPGFSAHADQQDLLRFIEGMTRLPRQVRLVHGDAGAKKVFRRVLKGRFDKMSIEIPS